MTDSFPLSYLDYAATAPLRPEARRVLAEAATGAFVGNPSGAHRAARRAKDALEEARETMAGVLGAQPSEIVFTSGGTESDNLAVAGVVARRPGRPVCPASEHPAVLRTCERLGGAIAAVGPDGRVDLESLEEVVGPDVAVVSVMLANNETGAITDLDPVARLVKRRAPGAVLHCDAVQAFPWVDVAEAARCAGLVSLSAHKFGGPPGVGVLLVRQGVPIEPLLRGGEQERGLRAGTPDVASIVAAVAAAVAAAGARDGEGARVAALRDRLVAGITERVAGAVSTLGRGGPGECPVEGPVECPVEGPVECPAEGPVDGASDGVPVDGPALAAPVVPGIAHLLFEGLESEELLVLLDEAGVCASAGSSCASGAAEPSHVLAAMGLSAAEARSALRFSLGWATTSGEVDHAATAVAAAAERLRSPVCRT